MTAESLFGRTASGEAVHRVELEGGGLRASISDWGATLLDLRLEGHAPPLVLGFEKFEDYPLHSPYFGATPGRFANRIAHGRFELDGVAHQLDRNQKGIHHLHGGSQGLGKRVWRIAELSGHRVRLEIDDPDGHMGYPGHCRIACTYELKSGGVLSVLHEAETDRPTPCGMAHHSYFNLDGGDDILDHELMIDADGYLPVDEDQIPNGEVAPVAQTQFDFRNSRPIRSEGAPFPYDHNFCLSDGRMRKRAVALLGSPRSGVSMEVRTSEPGLQFYCGFKMNIPVPGLEGRPYRAYGGVCLEAQNWPDSVNQAHFPDAVLRPGDTLVQATEYVFSKG